MKNQKLKISQNVEKTVVDTYKKIEDGAVGTYKKIENGVVGTYKKIEDKFTERFLTSDNKEKTNVPEDNPSAEKNQYN